MNWLRRAIVPAVLLLAVGGYFGYGRWRKAADAEMLENCAQATAQIWVATATFRGEPESMLEFRDSILIARNLTTEEMDLYVSLDEDEPEKYHEFVARINELVDSLVVDRIGPAPEDSTDFAELIDSTASSDTAGSADSVEVIVPPTP